AEFEREIVELIESLSNKKLLWVNIPIKNADFIPVLTNLDFEFHHCSNNSLMLVKKLLQESTIPSAKTHAVGVGAIVWNGNQLLVVKDRISSGYKLPGGYIDANETIKDALKREVIEETGIKVEFESIANIGHFMNGQFGEPNLYLVCTAKATTVKITIYDSSEIIEARWIDIDEFLNSTKTNSYNKNVVRTVLANKDLKLTEQSISLRVRGEVFS
ncbi:MAG: NUDIX domain-containing protein, partial [candidate division Zixibacteria bacterium]|nr:NUDIX domain-containing protein [candidate division Zixibacteria bacterium]